MQTAAQQDTSRNVQRFFEAMNYVFREKNEMVRNIADTLAQTVQFDRMKTPPLHVKYALRDASMWEPSYDERNKKHGWRPYKSRSIFESIADWFYHRKHGRDRGFVEDLPDGPIRQPAYFLEELWIWNTSLDPANHYLMARQEYQQFHTFMLLAYMRRPQLEQRLSRYEDPAAFTNSLAYEIGDASHGVNWNTIRRFHAEVMEAMKKVP